MVSSEFLTSISSTYS